MDELDLYIAKAMRRIEDLYNKTLGACYLSFSGGKDSTIILALIKMCEESGTIPKNAIPAVYCDTKIELTATTDFVKWVKENWYGNVQIIKTEKLFTQVIQESGKPFRSKLKSHIIRYYQNDPESKTAKYLYDDAVCKSNMMRLANRDFHILHKDFNVRIADKCCDEMKKKPFEKYVADYQMEGNLTGMRAAEGGATSIQLRQSDSKWKSALHHYQEKRLHSKIADNRLDGRDLRTVCEKIRCAIIGSVYKIRNDADGVFLMPL